MFAIIILIESIKEAKKLVVSWNKFTPLLMEDA